jgi:PTS system ascorbate-specific IIA component
MLVRALTYRNEPLETLARKAVSGGIDGVMRMPSAGQGDAATGS